MMFRIAIIILIVSLTSLGGCQTTAPIAEDAVFFRPEHNVPTEYAKFFGLWEGTWDPSGRNAKLAVQDVTADGHVRGIYAWGESSKGRWGGARIFRGKITNDVIQFDFDYYRFFNFSLTDEGTLEASASRPLSSGVFMKKPIRPCGIEARPPSNEDSTSVAEREQDVRVEYSDFLGTWRGVWPGPQKFHLIVTDVTTDGFAKGRQGWAAHPNGRFSAGIAPFLGKIDQRVLKDNDYPFRFYLVDKNTIEGTAVVTREKKEYGRFVPRSTFYGVFIKDRRISCDE